MSRRAIDCDQFLLGVKLKADIADPDAYPMDIPAVRDIEAIELHPAVTFLVGENGSGKSTIVEALAVAMGMNAEGGSQNFRFSTRESHSRLSEMVRPVRGVRRPRSRFFLRAESAFNVASEIEALDAEHGGGPPIIESYGGRSLHEQSHGESFMALMLNRFGAQGFYILDEPESALSPARQLALLSLIHRLVGERCQFVIATHSPILMAYPHAWLYELGSEGAARTDYQRTAHYRLTLDFLRDPERRIAALLADVPEDNGMTGAG